MTSQAPGATGRRYGGQDADERRAARRAALVAAGLDLFGTQRYARVSVKQVCERSRLTQRYFYESFGDREALLLAVYDAIVARVRDAVLLAVAGADGDVRDVARAGLGAFVDVLTGDERLARVMLLEVVGVSAQLEARRYGVVHEFADLVAAVVADRFGLVMDERRSLAAVGLVGATNQLLVDWISAADARAEPALLRDVLADLFDATYQVMLQGPPG